MSLPGTAPLIDAGTQVGIALMPADWPSGFAEEDYEFADTAWTWDVTRYDP